MIIKNEKKFDYDKKKKQIKIKSYTEEEVILGVDQAKGIMTDMENRIKQADEMLKRSNEMKKILSKMNEQPRFKEIIETVIKLMPQQIQMPNMESLNAQVKYWDDYKKINEKDLKELKGFIKGVMESVVFG